VDASPEVCARFVQILGFWIPAAESWRMMNLRGLQWFDPGLKHLKHELYVELIEQAARSAESVMYPRLVFYLLCTSQGNVDGFKLAGDVDVPSPFNVNLQNCLALNEFRIKPLTSPDDVQRALWSIACLGYHHADRKAHFTGSRDFTPANWTHIRPLQEAATVQWRSVSSLLHVQTQLSAGIFPVVMTTELGTYYACLLANAGGWLLKIFHMSESLDIHELRNFVRESLRRRSKDVLIVVAGLEAVDFNTIEYSKLCRIREETEPQRLHVVLCK
jgi:hypothetical protein